MSKSIKEVADKYYEHFDEVGMGKWYDECETYTMTPEEFDEQVDKLVDCAERAKDFNEYLALIKDIG